LAPAVVSAQAGTHIPETVVMGPHFRGDDKSGAFAGKPADRSREVLSI
jgi:hypothetical protein